MSTYAPAVLLDGPLPRPPKYNLLTVAQEVPDTLEADGGVNDRWASGVIVYPYPDELPVGFDPCSTGTGRDKGEGSPVDLQEFNAFTAYVPIKCTAAGARDDEAFRARATAALSAATPWAVERQLILGDPMPLNPFITDANLVEYAGAAISVHRALAVAERRIALTGKAGVIHMSADAASLLMDSLVDVSGVLHTISVGTPVVVGYGYQGVMPNGLDADPLNEDHSWLYVTGPVFYKLSDMVINPPNRSEALDRSSNDLVYRAEREVLVGWDAQLQFGVEADLSI